MPARFTTTVHQIHQVEETESEESSRKAKIKWTFAVQEAGMGGRWTKILHKGTRTESEGRKPE